MSMSSTHLEASELQREVLGDQLTIVEDNNQINFKL